MRILAISGSLSSQSANTRLLTAMRDAAKPPDEVVLFESVDDIPHFSPERDVDPVPWAVVELRRAMRGADAVVIATPEYAGGMPGSLKNTLDWLVGSGELYDKPAVVLSAAPSEERGHNARQSLGLTLGMQGARVCESFTVRAARNAPAGSLDDEAGTVLRRTLDALAAGMSGG